MRLMVFIANHPERRITLREASESEGISLKYLEQLAHELVSQELLISSRGHGGGYRLSRDASEILAGDILRAAEGTTTPVSCAALEEDGPGCPREDVCPTVAFWSGLDQVIESYVDGITLADLVNHTETRSACIKN